MASPTPIKQYEFYHPGKNQMPKFKHEILQNGTTIFTTNKTQRHLHMPQIDILSPNETILASVKMQAWSRNRLLYLGNPDCSDKSTWTTLDASGWTTSSFTFPFNGREFSWTRTHNTELGASVLGTRDFKLVDESNKQVLAVFKINYAFVKRGLMATIDHFVELGQEMELISLAAVLGICCDKRPNVFI